MSRDSIFSKLRASLESVGEKTLLPDFDDSALVSKVRTTGTPREAFERNLTAAHGRVMDAPGDLIDFLKIEGLDLGYCDPSLMETIGNTLVSAGLELRTTFERANYEDYRFGITRATGGIAETGSLILDDTVTSDRMAALSPWVHIAVLSESDIHRTLPDAVSNLGPSRNIIWVTGPSKTADVEGILIEGVHGPGEQIAFIVA